ncbi:DNA translocase FtsK [Arsenicibacter rosenii]|uniref:DNA translocase FtsK n=1 Tax=Arsenicibacter rosenii TaxID=1750698 RepID=UPI0009F5F773
MEAYLMILLILKIITLFISGFIFFVSAQNLWRGYLKSQKHKHKGENAFLVSYERVVSSPDKRVVSLPDKSNILSEIVIVADFKGSLIVAPNIEVVQAKHRRDSDIMSELHDTTFVLRNYQYPTAELLNEYSNKDIEQLSDYVLEENKKRIEDILLNFGIGVKKIFARVGPTVTLYEITLTDGIRISKIKNLEDDITLSFATHGIRIVAPTTGEGTFGIEIPNKVRERVSIWSALTSKEFTQADMDLPIVLGKTIFNEIYVADLAKMPHLLIAGAMEQDKSAGLNTLLTSLIYKKHPAQLKFVLMTSKMSELILFNRLERHFLAKVPGYDEAILTDTKKIVNTLNSLCIEMDNRYNLLKYAKCRNIKDYNLEFVNNRLNSDEGHRFLPYIVLVIDELAELMMTIGKEAELPIARLAQLARAIGIHLIVATQQPSSDVITGLIKANFPARLSFKLKSKLESLVILDTGGAEKLVGVGDMLFKSKEDIIQLQCPFITIYEIYKITDFVGKQLGYDDAYFLPEFASDDITKDHINRDVDLTKRDPMFGFTKPPL